MDHDEDQYFGPGTWGHSRRGTHLEDYQGHPHPQTSRETDEYDATDNDEYEDEDNLLDDEFIPTETSHWEEQGSGGKSDDRPNDYEDNRQCEYDDDPQYDYENQDENHRDQEFLFRCAARYKYGVLCKSIFETEEDISAHLVACHHTHKWLVHTYIQL